MPLNRIKLAVTRVRLNIAKFVIYLENGRYGRARARARGKRLDYLSLISTRLPSLQRFVAVGWSDVADNARHSVGLLQRVGAT